MIELPAECPLCREGNLDYREDIRDDIYREIEQMNDSEVALLLAVCRAIRNAKRGEVKT